MPDVLDTQRIDGRPLARRLHEQAVLDVIFSGGPLTRVQVADLIGLSKPTVASIVGDLVKAGLVQESGRTSGAVGRTAALYEVNPAVGHVVGIDLGGTKVRAALCDLFGTILTEEVRPTDTTNLEALVDQILSIADRLIAVADIRPESVRALALGTPGVVDPLNGVVNIAYNIPPLVGVSLATRLAEARDWRVIADNDVNMAAVGERWRGLANRCDSFAFLAVGTGIGMGLLLKGEIWQGHRGAAGEIGHIPLGRDPFDPSLGRAGAFEGSVSGRGIVLRYEKALSDRGEVVPDGLTAEAVFDAASRGEDAACSVIDDEARLLAFGIAAVDALIAPEMVVLGGGIGASSELLEPIRYYLTAIHPDSQLRVETSALGHRAPLFGALAIGLQAARSAVGRAPIVPRAPGTLT